jgi:uncharacterized damage-inducible protein DinB
MQEIRDISISSLFAYWKINDAVAHDCLELAPDTLLSWAPFDGMRKLGQIFVHIATAKDFWLTTIFRDGGVWIPSAQHSYIDRISLADHMTESFERLDKFASEGDLIGPYKYKEREVSGYWALYHLFEHDVHHISQIMTYLRLNNITPPER